MNAHFRALTGALVLPSPTQITMDFLVTVIEEKIPAAHIGYLPIPPHPGPCQEGAGGANLRSDPGNDCLFLKICIYLVFSAALVLSCLWHRQSCRNAQALECSGLVAPWHVSS